jgi:hypothetical protein
MLTTELYYLKIENKLAHLYKVAHLFSPDLMLAKVVDFDGGEEPINELMYCEIERGEDGDPKGWFFDSVEPAMLLAAENGCRQVTRKGGVVEVAGLLPV